MAPKTRGCVGHRAPRRTAWAVRRVGCRAPAIDRSVWRLLGTDRWSRVDGPLVARYCAAEGFPGRNRPFM